MIAKPSKIVFLRALASQKGLKGTNTDLSTSLINLWERKPTKGGGARRHAAPLCRFSLSHKLIRLVLKSRIFSFQSFLACRGSQKLHLLGAEQESIKFWWIHCCFLLLFSKLRTKSKNSLVPYLRIQGRMQIFVFCSKSCFWKRNWRFQELGVSKSTPDGLALHFAFVRS